MKQKAEAAEAAAENNKQQLKIKFCTDRWSSIKQEIKQEFLERGFFYLDQYISRFEYYSQNVNTFTDEAGAQYEANLYVNVINTYLKDVREERSNIDNNIKNGSLEDMNTAITQIIDLCEYIKEQHRQEHGFLTSLKLFLETLKDKGIKPPDLGWIQELEPIITSLKKKLKGLVNACTGII